MKRTPLSIGSTIQAKGGSSYTYIIDRVIGDGASSIVYEAHYVDNAYGKHDVRLKECYPYASNIQRSGAELIWADSETAMNDKVAFTTAYHKLLEFQNTTKLRNSTAHIFDLCEANGTLYSVMDVNEGQTFEQDNSEKLSDILKTTLALARVVEKYHNNGYLHLDIKPSNFLVIPETRELVILFDVDSVASMEDIASGKVKCVSYSKGWAAPEQMQGRIDKLCPATDIYSIGAILFQKVMGRAVGNEDIGIFADWNFDGELFERVNPKIKRLLRDIFHKTLVANTKRRYHTVKELIFVLEQSVKTAEQIQYIKSYYPTSNALFVGRQSELKEIRNAFDDGKKCVIVQGNMGMGKSSVAIQYARLYSKDYDTVCWTKLYDSAQSETISCDDKIKMSLNALIENGDAEDVSNSFIKLVTSNTLVIIDNYDVSNISKYIEDLLSAGCKVLITTRTVFKNLGEDFYSISLAGLKQEELLHLFETISEQKYEYTDRLFDFFEDQQMLTYSIILGAGQIKESCISLDEFLDDVYSVEYSENIIYDNVDDQALNHHRRTARLHLLSEEQLETLRTVFVMSYAINPHTKFLDSINGVFDRAVFKAYTGMSLNALNSLIRSRTISEDEDGTLSLHPSIQKIVECDFRPSCQNCPHLYNKVTQMLDFTIDQGALSCGVVLDIESGYNHEDDIAKVHELFDVYTWLCESDSQKTKHLVNLFALLKEYDTTQETQYWDPEDNEYWHLDWSNREYFVLQLWKALVADEGKQLFSDENYQGIDSPAPAYETDMRICIFAIDVCRHLLVEMINDYDNFQTTLAVLANAMNRISQHIIVANEFNEANVLLLNQTISMCKPLFFNCLPITKQGYYVEWYENIKKYPLAEGILDDDYPYSVPICAWISQTTYMLYQIMNLLLMEWLRYYGVSSETAALKDQADEISDWSRRISIQLFRIDKRFTTFYDFYAETPRLYNGVKDVDERYISENYVFFDFGFDDDRGNETYVSEILLAIKTSKKPFYLYSLILDKDFPLSNVAYDILLDAKVGQLILEDEHLSDAQKAKLFKRAVEEFIAYEENWDETDAKRLASAKQYSLSRNGDLLRDQGNAIETTNHIVFLWYDIIKTLFGKIKLSKQYTADLIRQIREKYISAIIGAFDYELYQEYGECIIADIPEFECQLETALYELIGKNSNTSYTWECVMSDSIYNLSHGLPIKYKHKAIEKAIETYVESEGEGYNPFDNELLEYWDLL